MIPSVRGVPGLHAGKVGESLELAAFRSNVLISYLSDSLHADF